MCSYFEIIGVLKVLQCKNVGRLYNFNGCVNIANNRLIIVSITIIKNNFVA